MNNPRELAESLIALERGGLVKIEPYAETHDILEYPMYGDASIGVNFSEYVCDVVEFSNELLHDPRLVTAVEKFLQRLPTNTEFYVEWWHGRVSQSVYLTAGKNPTEAMGEWLQR